MDVHFCKEALQEAIEKYDKPEIFNTDQGSQFTSNEFTEILVNNGIAISMDGKGSFIDNVFIERFWRSLKYEEVYLKAYDNTPDAALNIGNYIWDYNNDRHHSALGGLPPSEVYFRRYLSIENSLCYY
jgi:putative transposase